MNPLFTFHFVPSLKDLFDVNMIIINYDKKRNNIIMADIIFVIIAVAIFIKPSTTTWVVFFLLSLYFVIWNLMFLGIRKDCLSRIKRSLRKRQVGPGMIYFYENHLEAISEDEKLTRNYDSFEKIIISDRFVVIMLTNATFIALKRETMPDGLADFCAGLKEKYAL